MRPIRAVTPITAIAAIAGIALAGTMLSGTGGRVADRPRTMTSQAHYVWGDTPRDWVSWADHIAIVEVLGEEKVPFEAGQFEGGSGWVARRIQARIAERIWARPDAASPPSSVKLKTTDGWWYKDGQLIPIKDLGAHRSEVGDRLLVAMFNSRNWGWTLMSGGTPVDAAARLDADHDQTDIGDQLDGMELPQLAQTFRSAKPFADVIRFQHLDPEQRMIAVHKYAQSRAGSRDG